MHLIFCNHTGSGVILNVHKICLSRCIEGLDPWISDVTTTKEELMKLPQRPSGLEWDALMKILTSAQTILVRWGMANDRIAFKNSFGITLIQTKGECRFFKGMHQLHRQAQGVDLQKANSISIIPTLCGYISDPKARANPAHTKLDYCAICHTSCGMHEHVAGMALMLSALDHDGQGTDERLLNLFHAAKHKLYMQLVQCATDRE